MLGCSNLRRTLDGQEIRWPTSLWPLSGLAVTFGVRCPVPSVQGFWQSSIEGLMQRFSLLKVGSRLLGSRLLECSPGSRLLGLCSPLAGRDRTCRSNMHVRVIHQLGLLIALTRRGWIRIHLENAHPAY